eukprot:scaffold53237_cov28-Tisochrysis_lutea.AAC.3
MPIFGIAGKVSLRFYLRSGCGEDASLRETSAPGLYCSLVKFSGALNDVRQGGSIYHVRSRC